MRKRTSAAAIVTALALAASSLSIAATSIATGELAGAKVCIDAGHGGTDPGAVNAAFNLEEADINLDVAYALRALLQASGAEVVMTRQDDSYLTNNDRYTLCNGEAATILVSVHANSVADPLTDGTLALYMKKSDAPLARAVHDAACAGLTPGWPDADPFIDFGLTRFPSGVLLKSTMPSAIAEPLFMSNPGEAVLLAQRIYDDPAGGVVAAGCGEFSCRRGQIAAAIHQGVLNYFSGGGAAPTPTPAPTRCRGKSCG